MNDDEKLLLIRDLYRAATWGAKDQRVAQKARDLLKQNNVKLYEDDLIESPPIATVAWDPSTVVNTKRLSPVQAKARLLKGRAYAKAVKADPTLAVVRNHMKADDYASQFLGGRNCARLTIPIVNVDQIRSAAILLRELGNDMQEIADEQGPVLGKVLAARGLLQTINRKLKGGVHYKGAR